LVGNGTAPPNAGISITPKPLAFGNVGVNSSQLKDITIQNNGYATLLITNVSIGGSRMFELPNGEDKSTATISIAPNASRTLVVKYLPTSVGEHVGEITLHHNSTVDNGTSTINLVGAGVSSGTPVLSLNVTSIAFGDVTLNSPKVESITIKNDGNATLNITGFTFGGGAGFTLPNNETNISIQPGATYTLSVQFLPTTTTNRTANLTLTHNATGGSTNITLSGRGTQPLLPTITVTASLNFSEVIIGTPSILALSIQNTGTANLEVSSMSIDGVAFSLQGTTLFTVTPGSRVSISVVFIPTEVKAYTGSITIKHNAGEDKTVALTGTGIKVPEPTVTLEATSLNFGTLLLNVTSSPQNIKLTNTGNATLNITGVSITGGDFSLPNNENTSVTAQNPIQIQAGASRNIAVTFKPTVAESRTGYVTLNHNATGGSNTITLTGIGALAAPAISLDHMNVPFGDVELNESKYFPVVITSTGTANLVIASINITGMDASSFSLQSSSTHDITLVPGATHTVTVRFTPTGAGIKTANITISSNAGTGTNTVSLSGTGKDVAISVPGLDRVVTYKLMQNYPNPFNPTTKIQYSLPEASYVRLSVFTELGQEVRQLVNANQAAGQYIIDFDAENLKSGIYLYRLQTEKFVETKKMLLLK